MFCKSAANKVQRVPALPHKQLKVIGISALKSVSAEMTDLSDHFDQPTRILSGTRLQNYKSR